MTSVQVLNSQISNASNASIQDVPRQCNSVLYKELSSVTLKNNQIETSIDPIKNNYFPNNCQRCAQLELKIKELESKIKKLTKQLHPPITNRFQRTIKGGPISRSRNGIYKDGNRQNCESQTEQLKDSLKILKFSYAIDQKVLQKQRKMLLQIEQRADKLSRKEKRQRIILKQMIQKQNSSFQTSSRRSPQPLRLSLSNQKQIPQIIQNSKNTTVANIPASFNNFKEQVNQFLKDEESITIQLKKQYQKVEAEVNIQSKQKNKQRDDEAKRQIYEGKEANEIKNNQEAESMKIATNEKSPEISETKAETSKYEQTSPNEQIKIEIVSQPIQQQSQIIQIKQQQKIEQLNDLQRQNLQKDKKELPVDIQTQQNSPSKVKRAQSYNVPIQLMSSFQAQEQQQQKKPVLKKSNSQILDNIPQANQSQLQQFMMKDNEGQKYGQLDIFKSKGTSPKLDSSVISASSKGKSVTSNMNAQQLEYHYNSKIRNSKLLAKLKKKK